MNSKTNPKAGLSRREFLHRASLTAAGLWMAPSATTVLRAAAPGDLLLHASIGAGGMARSDIEGITRGRRARLVAVADVDLAQARALKKEFLEVKIYQDWRELLDKEKSIHSVNVTVPDHMHAPIAMAAMQLGKHVYCQKPLTHDVHETRRLTEYAREKKLVTQMGIQIHSSGTYREAVRIIQEGTIGKIREVHTWSGKAWGDPTPLPQRSDTAPADFNWDLWLGTAAPRPFIGDGYYHPGNWRKRLDFGTGTFGDMGCHIYDPVFNALTLTAPISIRSEGPAPNPWNWAVDARIEYVFPGTAFTEGQTVKITWYDGKERPPKEVQPDLDGDQLPDQGSLFLGTKGTMLLPHIARARLFPEKDFAGRPRPRMTENDHWQQFVDACLGNGRTSAHFDYAGPLTEAVLLGSVATRFPNTTLEWNAQALTFKNLPAADQYIRRTYRQGWEVKGLS